MNLTARAAAKVLAGTAIALTIAVAPAALADTATGASAPTTGQNAGLPQILNRTPHTPIVPVPTVPPQPAPAQPMAKPGQQQRPAGPVMQPASQQQGTVRTTQGSAHVPATVQFAPPNRQTRTAA